MNTIEEAIRDLVSGKMIIVMDDEDRENEGDLICSAELCTHESVNFMSTHGKGLICVAITEQRAKELELNAMVQENSALHSTKFTVSVDYIHGTSTGISAFDRAATIRALSNYDTKPSDLGRPGHIFPLVATDGGVLRRSGHTEATVDLMKLAGLKPSGVLCEIINKDGSMARLDDIIKFAEEHNLKIITIKDLISHRIMFDKLVTKTLETEIDTAYGLFKLLVFENTLDGSEHIALVKGSWEENEPVLVRAHSESVMSFFFGILKSKIPNDLTSALSQISNHGNGVLLFIDHDKGKIKLKENIEAYSSQYFNKKEIQSKLGINSDPRDFGIGAQILQSIGVKKMILITDSPKKRVGITSYGIEIVNTVPLK